MEASIVAFSEFVSCPPTRSSNYSHEDRLPTLANDSLLSALVVPAGLPGRHARYDPAGSCSSPQVNMLADRLFCPCRRALAASGGSLWPQHGSCWGHFFLKEKQHRPQGPKLQPPKAAKEDYLRSAAFKEDLTEDSFTVVSACETLGCRGLLSPPKYFLFNTKMVPSPLLTRDFVLTLLSNFSRPYPLLPLRHRRYPLARAIAGRVTGRVKQR